MSSRSPGWYGDVPPRPAPAPRAEGGRWQKPCHAVDAETGLQCRRLQHADEVHRHERGEFRRVAAPGQTTFVKVEQLVAAATARPDSHLGTGGERLAAHREAHRVRQNQKRAAARAAAEVPDA